MSDAPCAGSGHQVASVFVYYCPHVREFVMTYYSGCADETGEVGPLTEVSFGPFDSIEEVADSVARTARWLVLTRLV